MLPEFLFPAGAVRDGGRHLLMHLGKIIESTISQHHETPRSQAQEPTADSGHLKSTGLPGEAARKRVCTATVALWRASAFWEAPELLGHRTMLEHT